MTLLPLVAVLVLGAGGPAGLGPNMLNNSTVKVVTPAGKTLGVSNDGELRLRLKRGTYRAVAQLHTDASEPQGGPMCNSVTFLVARRSVERTTPARKIDIYCSIK